MSDLAFAALQGLWISVQILGLWSAFAARRALDGAWRGRWEWCFYSCLGLVGLTTVGGLGCSTEACLASGTTLAVMTLAATWDPRRPAGEAL